MTEDRGASSLAAEQALAALEAGDALMASGRPRAAASAYGQAVRQLASPAAYRRLAGAHYAARDFYAADDVLRAWLGPAGPRTAAEALMVARLAMELLEFPRAEAAVKLALGLARQDPDVTAVAVRLHVWQGRHSLGMEVLYDALAAHPDDWQLLALALSHDREVSPERVRRATHLAAAAPDDSVAKTALLFPLARYHDRAGDVDRAWSTMQQANLLQSRRQRRGMAPVAPEILREHLVARAHTATVIAAAGTRPSVADDSPRFAYLVGAPRTGSSLIQAVLGAHTGVASVGERGALVPHLMGYIERADSAAFWRARETLAGADRAGLARQSVRGDVVLDKMTHTYFVLPLVRAVHPAARFINVLRDPRDVLISMLFHEFPPAFAESCDPGSIASALEAREIVAQRYEDAGLDSYNVCYANFVRDPDLHGARMAAHLGITWDPGTLDPARRNSAIATFSAGRAREPIAPAANDAWRRFERFIQPWLESLSRLDELQRRRCAG